MVQISTAYRWLSLPDFRYTFPFKTDDQFVPNQQLCLHWLWINAWPVCLGLHLCDFVIKAPITRGLIQFCTLHSFTIKSSHKGNNKSWRYTVFSGTSQQRESSAWMSIEESLLAVVFDLPSKFCQSRSKRFVYTGQANQQKALDSHIQKLEATKPSDLVLIPLETMQETSLPTTGFRVGKNKVPRNQPQVIWRNILMRIYSKVAVIIWLTASVKCQHICGDIARVSSTDKLSFNAAWASHC